MRFLWKLRWAWHMLESLKRRAEVEQVLLDYANGKREFYRDEARDLALYLGDRGYTRRLK